MIIISVIGLITIPLFPWFGIEDERDHNETDEEITVVRYTYGNSRYLHMIADIPSRENVYEDLDGDISMISICFWMSLFFGIIAIGGVLIYRTGRAEGFAHIMLLIGAVVIVFSILALISHALFIVHLRELEEEMSGGFILSSRDDRVVYGYNFIPLIMSIFLLIISIFYLIRIVPYSGKMVSWAARKPRYVGQPMFPQYQQPPPQPIQQPGSITKVTCSNCKNIINIQTTSLPTHVQCPVCKTVGLFK